MSWIFYALLAALCFGLRGVFYQWTSQKTMNRNLMLCGVFFTGFLVSIFFLLLQKTSFDVSISHILVGASMGVLSFLANASLYKGYAVGKASLVSVLAGLPPLIVVVLAFLLWNETLTAIQLWSFFIIFVGIYLIRYSNDLSLTDLKGAHWGLLAALFFGLNDIMGKQSTRVESDMFITLLLMFGVGSFLFLLGWLANRHSRNQQTTELSWSTARTFNIGMLVGITNVGGMVAILTAFATGPTGMVSAISALNLLVVLFYTRFFLRVPFRLLELIGIGFALVGLILLRLF
ncbi:DMT family transporter [Gilvimarinus polysaccharolyticus]|uniref:DMT family transporter n=1 Tax=Gilvimarinus polysaccharolyticus TaxID=863921 RepID=UPI000673B3AF|nr:DMT family transporter [Gilvimarinus polysaccharolyticus]